MRWFLGAIFVYTGWALGLAGWLLGWLLIVGPWTLFMEVHDRSPKQAGAPRRSCKVCNRYAKFTRAYQRTGYIYLAWPFGPGRGSRV